MPVTWPEDDRDYACVAYFVPINRPLPLHASIDVSVMPTGNLRISPHQTQVFFEFRPERLRKNGAPGAIPTRDLPLRRRTLYAAELREHR